ncbi:MAG: SH3 domain-containing protein [Actinomycetota bacterium]
MTAPAVAVSVWPQQSDESAPVEEVTGLGDTSREPPVSRGRHERPRGQHPGTSPTVSLSPMPTATNTTSTPTPEPAAESSESSEPTSTPSPEPTVTGEMYVTAGLNVRAAPSLDAEVLTVLPRATKVAVTSETDGAWVQIIHDDTVAWVSGDYLSEEKPPPEDTGGLSYAECEHGSEVESGLTPDAIRVHRAVCAEFPGITEYGGWRSGGGEHSAGRAIDIMVSNQSTGDAIAAFVREHYQELGVSQVIWWQQIWTVERADEGWRWMEDRGSATQNHYDHIHVTVYGDSGG